MFHKNAVWNCAFICIHSKLVQRRLKTALAHNVIQTRRDNRIFHAENGIKFEFRSFAAVLEYIL